MAEFNIDGNKAIMRMGIEDISNNTPFFKTHREYIEAVFKQHGFEIIKWNWEQNTNLPRDPITGNYPWIKHEDGLKFMSTDRAELIEITGTIGVNIRRIYATDTDSKQGTVL